MREALLDHITAPGADRQRPLRLHALRSEGQHITEGLLHDDGGRWWWIAGGVPRLLPPTMYRNAELERTHAAELRRLGLDLPDTGPSRTAPRRLARVQAQTIDRFGAEWLTFRDWGYHTEPPGGDPLEYQGGLWANTLAAFRSKTFLDGRLHGKLVLDAGCGNGRFTAAALANGAREVIAADIGWGVDAAFEHHRDDPRVHVIQASLFDLPVRAVDAAFSLGVLMHTGDAARAFDAIARIVKPGGLFAVRMYHRGNWLYEALDASIRTLTTRQSKPAQMRFARRMARLGAHLAQRDKHHPGARMRWYAIIRNWPTIHHNLDWWSAPVASHHTAPQVARWGASCGLTLLRADPSPDRAQYPFWQWPEALTILFERPALADTAQAHAANAARSNPGEAA